MMGERGDPAEGWTSERETGLASQIESIGINELDSLLELQEWFKYQLLKKLREFDLMQAITGAERLKELLDGARTEGDISFAQEKIDILRKFGDNATLQTYYNSLINAGTENIAVYRENKFKVFAESVLLVIYDEIVKDTGAVMKALGQKRGNAQISKGVIEQGKRKLFGHYLSHSTPSPIQVLFPDLTDHEEQNRDLSFSKLLVES